MVIPTQLLEGMFQLVYVQWSNDCIFRVWSSHHQRFLMSISNLLQYWIGIPQFIWLVVSTPLKNMSQLGWLFPIYGKIKFMFQSPPTSHGYRQNPQWGFEVDHPFWWKYHPCNRRKWPPSLLIRWESPKLPRSPRPEGSGQYPSKGPR